MCPYILRVIAKSWGVRGCESEGIKGVYKNSKHRSEGIKQCEIITISGNRVGAGQVPRSAIDGVRSEISPGLSGLSGLSMDKTR